MQQPKLVVVARMDTPYIYGLLFAEPKAHDQRVQYRHASIPQPPEQLRCEAAEARQDVFWKLNIVLLEWILFAADLIAFLDFKKRVCYYARFPTSYHRPPRLDRDDTDLVIRNPLKLLLSLLIFCIHGSFRSPPLPAYSGVSPMGPEGVRMRRLHLLLERQVKKQFARVEGIL